MKSLTYTGAVIGTLSPPSRRRGLKCQQIEAVRAEASVASLAEAWVEMARRLRVVVERAVASLAEAWVEIARRRRPRVLCLRRLPRGGVG